MPLAHKMSSVVFIMPYHVEALERVEKLLTRQQLNTWMGKMEQRAVAVSLPKVSMEVSHNLQVLQFQRVFVINSPVNSVPYKTPRCLAEKSC